jgi:hypothetical protein
MNMDKAVRSAMELYNKITFTKVDEEFISEISKGVL